MDSSLQNPDAELFAKIDYCANLWHQSLALDEQVLTARRLVNLSEAKELTKRHDQAIRGASKLELEILCDTAAVVTVDGHAAKVDLVAGSSFDSEDLIAIAWALGHEAGRLGLSNTMPPALQRMASAAEG